MTAGKNFVNHRSGYMGAVLFLLSTRLIFLACQLTSTEDNTHVLNIRIDKDNDSLLKFDTLIITVYSKDSSFKQEVFHGKLSNPEKIQGIKLDPKVGSEYKVVIVGYKSGNVSFNKQITVLGPGFHRDGKPADCGYGADAAGCAGNRSRQRYFGQGRRHLADPGVPQTSLERSGRSQVDRSAIRGGLGHAPHLFLGA